MTSAFSRSGSSANAALSATATDNVRVTRVDFFNNGVRFATFTSPPYQVSFRLSNGTNRIQACAVDAAGNRGCGVVHVATR